MSLKAKLLQSIKDFPEQKLNLSGAGLVYGFGYNDDRLDLARHFECKTKVVNSLSEIAWTEIFSRSVSFTKLPPKNFAETNNEKLKRFALRCFGRFVGDEINICWLHEALFLDHGEKTLFTTSAHVAQLYAKHLPQFKVLQVISVRREVDLRDVFELGEHLRGRCVDGREGVTVFANVIAPSFIRLYRKLHPNRRIILRFHDILKIKPRDERDRIVELLTNLRATRVVDSVESYDFDDAKVLKGKFRPNGVDPDFILSTDVSYRERLCHFSGASEVKSEKTSRINDFAAVMDKLKTLYPNTSKWSVVKNHDPRNKWLPYEEFVKVSSRSEICVDLFRLDPEEGFSFRIPEALWLNRKIISNRLCLRKEPFYSSERIFLIGIDPIERLRSFLETDIEPLPKEILRLYDTRLWWTEDDPAQEVCE